MRVQHSRAVLALRPLASVLLLVATVLAGGPAGAAADRTLRAGLVALPPALGNPFRDTQIPSSYTMAAIFDGLTRFVDQGELQPWLALSWERTDPVTWRFRLRPGVLFQDGSKFDAAAVAAAIDYVTSPAAQRESIARELHQVKAARIVDELTVEIETRYPDPTLPRSLPVLWIPQPALWREKGPEGFAQAPIGTGPFKLERWTPTRAVLVAHRQAWRAPQMERLELIAMPEADTRLQSIAAGAIDIAIGLGADEIEGLAAAGIHSLVTHEPGVMGVAFLTTKPGPLADLRVRRALILAVNRQLIVEKGLGGFTRTAALVAPPGVIGYDPAIGPLPYDPVRARQLLVEAGYGNGFHLIFEVVLGGTAGDVMMYQQIAADLRKVKVELELRAIPLQKLLTNLAFGGWTSDGFSIPYSSAPSRDALRALRVNSCLGRAPWFCDQDLTARIEATSREPDLDRRIAQTRELVAAYYDAAPHLSVYDNVRFFGLAPTLTGFGEANDLIDWAAIDRR
jgi:peptide/nickel transport system substrate-binding protein